MSPAVEILQGTLALLILKTLALEPMHGWGIAQRIQQGSLYPALYRLARFYTLTKTGRQQLEREMADWKQMSTAVALILQRV